jgi:hypothetical protein
VTGQDATAWAGLWDRASDAAKNETERAAWLKQTFFSRCAHVVDAYADMLRATVAGTLDACAPGVTAQAEPEETRTEGQDTAVEHLLAVFATLTDDELVALEAAIDAVQSERAA